MNVDTLVTAITENGGFTLDLDTARVLQVGQDTGWCIAVPGTERVIGHDLTANAFTAAVADAMASVPVDDRPDVKIGGWYSPDRGYMVELTNVFRVDQTTAEIIGDIRDQDAIFDLETGTEITLRRAPVLIPS